MDTHLAQKLPRSLLISVLLLIAALVIACDLSFAQTKPKMDATDIAYAVKETLEAERIKEETPLAAASDTPIMPEPIPSSTPTRLTDTTITTTPSSPTTATLLEHSYTRFSALYWVSLTSGCQNNDAKCYKLNDDYKTLGGQADAVLTTKDAIFIEESWPNPHLVFWNKRNLKYQATINLLLDGNPITVQFVPKGEVGRWKEDFLNLSEYRGKSVGVQFVCPVGMKYINSWLLNDLRVVPNYTPK